LRENCSENPENIFSIVDCIGADHRACRHFRHRPWRVPNARAWDDVVRRLERAGHKAIAVDLPGRGGGDAKAQTLTGYRDAVLRIVNAQSEPVVLVGHSFGGLTISEVAEAAPEKIRKLIYVAAYLPRKGDSLQSLSGEDKDNKLTKENFVVAPDYSTANVLPRDGALIFANDANGAGRAAIANALMLEPLAPMAGQSTVTPEKFGTVSKDYIFTLRDNAVSLPQQRRMVERTPVAHSYEINTGHSPFATQPARLTALLIRASKD
jgi:pimeloyl-ACP methyl ester carboxylesterase